MKRTIPIILVAAAFAGIVALAWSRRSGPASAAIAHDTSRAIPRGTQDPAAPPLAAARPPQRAPSTLKLDPTKAGDMTHGEAHELSRIRSTFQSYRAAIAQDNPNLQSTLLSILNRDRKTALRVAEESLMQARDESSRSLTVRAMEALRR